MSYTPANSGSDLWVTLGALASAIVAVEWWSRRERARGASERDMLATLADPSDEWCQQDEGWPD